MAVKTDRFRFEVELEVIHSEDEPTKQAVAATWIRMAVEQGLRKVQSRKSVPVTTALRGHVLAAWTRFDVIQDPKEETIAKLTDDEVLALYRQRFPG